MYFYSQFLDPLAVSTTAGTEEEEEEVFESHSCSISNEADGLKDQGGPTVGKSVFAFNYNGVKILRDEPGLFNEINIAERVPEDEHQVWRLVKDETLLEHKSGNTDSWFSCSMERDFVDSKSQIQLKVGLELTWVWGYKVFELKNS